MPKRRRSSDSKRRLRANKRRRIVKKSRSKKLMNYRIKQVVKSLMEVKFTNIRGSVDIRPYVGGNQGQCDNTNIISFDPVINQGTGEGQRVGNAIIFTRVGFKFIAVMKPITDAGGACPQFLRLIFFYDKEDPNAVPTPYQSGNFLDNGNTSGPLTGMVNDCFYKYNSDRYRILGQRTYKIGFASNPVNSGSTGFQSFNNNDSPMVIRGRVNLTKWLIKKQKFNDNLGTSLTRKLYCLLLTVRQDGTVDPSLGTPRVAFTYETVYKYIDA